MGLTWINDRINWLADGYIIMKKKLDFAYPFEVLMTNLYYR